MFSVTRELEHGCFLRGRELVRRTGDGETVLTTRDEIFLRGLHNVENVLAAFAAALACGAGVDATRRAVAEFRGVEHRIEFVAEIDGVRYYNDSKATSVDAAVKALEALAEDEGKTVLILGGRGKNAVRAACAVDHPLSQGSCCARRGRGQYRGTVKGRLRHNASRFLRRCRAGRSRACGPWGLGSARTGLREF